MAVHKELRLFHCQECWWVLVVQVEQVELDLCLRELSSLLEVALVVALASVLELQDDLESQFAR